MSDKPEETSWQSFLRKAKYQMGREGGQKYSDQTWAEMMREAFEEGFLGNYDNAIDIYDAVLQNTYERLDKGVRTDAFSAKAVALEKLGRIDEALTAYDKAIEISPKQDELYNNKGILLAKLERHSEALVCFVKVVELTKDYKNDDKEDVERHADSLGSLAEGYLALGTTNDLNIALKLVDESIELNPKSALAYQVKATILSDESIEKYDEALENCEKALKIDPTDTDVLIIRALIYLNTEKYDLAKKEFLELLNHDPTESSTHYNLACIYSLLKNKQKAIDHLLVATYLDPPRTHSDMDEDESFDNIRDSKEFKRLQSFEDSV